MLTGPLGAAAMDAAAVDLVGTGVGLAGGCAAAGSDCAVVAAGLRFPVPRRFVLCATDVVASARRMIREKGPRADFIRNLVVFLSG